MSSYRVTPHFESHKKTNKMMQSKHFCDSLIWNYYLQTALRFYLLNEIKIGHRLPQQHVIKHDYISESFKKRGGGSHGTPFFKTLIRLCGGFLIRALCAICAGFWGAAKKKVRGRWNCVFNGESRVSDDRERPPWRIRVSTKHKWVSHALVFW